METNRKKQERSEAKHHEAERLGQERREAERLEAKRQRQERLEAERRERKRLDAERRKQERMEAERQKRERLEAERLERERMEAERRERKRIDAERREHERLIEEHNRQQLLNQVTAHHTDAQDKMRQEYESNLESLQQSLNAVDVAISQANTRLQQLSFLRFLEKRTLRAELEELTASRAELCTKITETQNEYRRQCDIETQHFNTQLIQHGFVLNSTKP